MRRPRALKAAPHERLYFCIDVQHLEESYKIKNPDVSNRLDTKMSRVLAEYDWRANRNLGSTWLGIHCHPRYLYTREFCKSSLGGYRTVSHTNPGKKSVFICELGTLMPESIFSAAATSECGPETKNMRSA